MNRLACGTAATFTAAVLSAGIVMADARTARFLDGIPGSTIAYTLHFDGSFWNGQRVVFSRVLEIAVSKNRAVHIVSSGSAKDDNATLQGTLAKDGSINAANAEDRLESFNTIAGVLRGAPASLRPGTTWKASVPIQTNGQGGTTAFPVEAKVVANDGGGTLIQGLGAQRVSTTYAGYPVPIDVKVSLSIRLTKSRFEHCDFAASELVYAGPQTQTLHWKWKVTRIAGGRTKGD